MAHAGSTIYHHDKRRYTRVSFERSVKLLTHDATSKPFHAKNLSLGGMFLEGRGDMSVGQDCRIELHETGHRASMIYHICGRIVHADHEGVGIQFTDMEDHSLMYLQTMLLYSSDDPITAAEHFAEGFTSSVSSPC